MRSLLVTAILSLTFAFVGVKAVSACGGMPIVDPPAIDDEIDPPDWGYQDTTDTVDDPTFCDVIL